MHTVKFENEHGSFELVYGSSYDFTVVDIESGELLPIYDVEVINETKEDVIIQKYGRVEYIKKAVIVQEELKSL